MNNIFPKPPVRDPNIHFVICPRWGTKSAVWARVGIRTDFIFYHCPNRDCGGAMHHWALNPSVRDMMTTTQAKQHAAEEDYLEEPKKKTAPKKRNKRREAASK
jgi:hypothetical protein